MLCSYPGMSALQLISFLLNLWMLVVPLKPQESQEHFSQQPSSNSASLEHFHHLSSLMLRCADRIETWGSSSKSLPVMLRDFRYIPEAPNCSLLFAPANSWISWDLSSPFWSLVDPKNHRETLRIRWVGITTILPPGWFGCWYLLMLTTWK